MNNKKALIGIITRSSISESNHPIKIIYRDLESAIEKSGGIPLGVSNESFKNYLDICDGFILEGGSELDPNNYPIIKYLWNKNIPLLAICLGMQEMATTFNSSEVSVSSHQNTTHKIHLHDNTTLYKILKTHHITVNSRHSSSITPPTLTVSASSEDGTIEAIEDPEKSFFIGLQFHPENIYEDNLHAKLIFDYFIQMCQNYKYSKNNKR